MSRPQRADAARTARERPTPRRSKLAELAKAFRADAERDAVTYARTTEVPGGGE